jgi:hypothetical protein
LLQEAARRAQGAHANMPQSERLLGVCCTPRAPVAPEADARDRTPAPGKAH